MFAGDGILRGGQVEGDSAVFHDDRIARGRKKFLHGAGKRIRRHEEDDRVLPVACL